MGRVKLSKKAKLDLREIAEYTLGAWGEQQADDYLGEIDSLFEQLAAFPDIGRSCPALASDLRCIEVRKHIVFYRKDRLGVVISRIIHERMLPSARMMNGNT